MNTYKRHRFPPDIISYAVWFYYRFNLSHRDIEDLLAERGRLQVVRETELTVETLGAAMRRAVAADRHVVAGVDLEGAQRTAVILRELASGG